MAREQKLQSDPSASLRGENRDERDGYPVIIDDEAGCPGFEMLPGYVSLQHRKAQLQQEDIPNPYFIARDGVSKETIHVDGRLLINFAGYNYVGLAGHPEVSKAAKEAIDRYGTSVSASRLVSGQIPLHTELERTIADFIGVDDCIAFVSGYGTNVTTIGHLFQRSDLLVHDELVHNSILMGCRLSGARRMSFPHNDWDRLERLLESQRKRFRRVGILVEGLYSMDGDFPNLPRLIEIKKRHDALLFIDEAHSLGVMGRGGRGIGEHFDVDRRDVDIWMGTLSKAFASCGGYIAGDGHLVDFLKYSAPGFIYSVGMSPPNCAAALAAFRLLSREPQRVGVLNRRAELFLELAREQGFDTGGCHGTPIVPVIVGDSLKCLKLSGRLIDRGVLAQPIIFPAVRERGARLRFFVTAMHSEEQVRRTINVLAEEKRRLENGKAGT